MGTITRHNFTAIAVVGLLAVGLTGCGGAARTVVQPTTAGDPAPAPTTSTTSASQAPAASPTAGRTMSQTEIEAAIAAGAPPRDLTWMPVTAPAGWTRLKSETGTIQWQTRDGCLVTLDQPGGIGTDPTLTSEDLLEGYAERNSAAFDGNPAPVYSGRTTRKVPNIVQGLDGTSLVTFREATVDYGRIRSRQLAYRNGDFGLIFSGFCRSAALFAKAETTDFDPFFTKLQVHTRY